VIERHWTDVRRYFVRRLRCVQEADDLTQEVCLRFLLLDENICPHKPLAYLYRIAANVLADFSMNSARRRNHVVIDSEIAESCSEQGCGAIEAVCVDTLALKEQLIRALLQLPPTHLAVLLAHKREGLSYLETAARLNLSVHTVEKYVTQAKARLRTMHWDR
jgi:RNA polymerase sigma-70 factor (ECF subfamily)